uniref:Apple domain-containing protein n=1 Tax=Caenorhabditis japonica TaxID=281687 RepID=A0A8R1DZ70_CAEJA
MIFHRITVLFLTTVTVILATSTNSSLKQKPPNLKLLECFEFKKNYWIVGHAFHTSSVQFKDECLRMCLTSSIRKAKCLSAMHVPNDDECVISDQDQVTKPDLFIENDTPGTFTVNFFRNICVDPPDSEGADRFEARLQGYKGGEGIIEFAHVDGKNLKVMVVLSGLKENSIYNVNILEEKHQENVGKCGKSQKVDGKTILTLETDHTGMAVEPWTEIRDFNELDGENASKKSVSNVMLTQFLMH